MVNVTYDKRFFCRNYKFIAHENGICVFKIVFENLLMHSQSILSIWIHLPIDKTRYANIQTLIKFRLGGVCTKDMRIIKMLTEWIKPTLTNGKGVDRGCNSGEHR